jgi:FkbM family methyltransferase
VSKIAIKGSIQRLFRRLGWEVQRAEHANTEQQILKKLLKLTMADVVLDVGANVGQFGDLLLGVGFKGTLVSFEAIADVHERLLQHAKGRSSSWLVAPCAALGSKRGEVEINISANSVSSSVLPMRQAHLESAPQSRYIGKQVVKIERLDELAISYIGSAAKLLIKVDTQGYELEVLTGAAGLWPRTVALQLELSLVPLYDHAPTFLEMIAFMSSMGFDLFGFAPGFRDSQSGRMLQVDGFFVRADPGSAAS